MIGYTCYSYIINKIYFNKILSLTINTNNQAHTKENESGKVPEKSSTHIFQAHLPRLKVKDRNENKKM